MVDKFINWALRHSRFVIGMAIVITAVLTVVASRVDIKTVFSDLLPQNHPYIEVNNRFKQTFGGANVVSIMVETHGKDIFDPKFLSVVQGVTRDLERVQGADPYQIISLASKKLKEIKSSTEGIQTRPLMWPDIPQDVAALAKLKRSVLDNPLVYGAYVSQDLKSALITVDFYDHLVDYKTIYEQVYAIVDKYKDVNVDIQVAGEPVLYGWVIHYLSETAHIFLGTIACLVLLLLLVTRTIHGTVLPLAAAAISAVWAVAFAVFLNYNLDPLVIVVAFLITALAISNTVQVVSRFDHKLRHGIVDNVEDAARASIKKLFRPAMLAVAADAGCMLVVALTPIPLLQKIAFIGCFWVLSIAVTGVLLPGLALSWTRRPEHVLHPINVGALLHKILEICARITVGRGRYVVLAISAAAFVVSGIYAFNLKIGDANPGSPILWPDSIYNKDAAAINNKFQGADRMFIVFSGGQPDAMKQPKALNTMAEFQRFMEAQPEIGGSLSVADVLPAVNSVLHEGNPRYLELGGDASANGELAYLFGSGSDPGDIERYADPDFKNASVTLFFRDHQGDTIRNAVARIKEFSQKNPLDDGTYLLAGGLAGVLAAVNEVILSGQIEAIAFALLVLVVAAAITYRSMVAGIFFMIPVILSNTLTFSYMAAMGIGMNINTLPVVALGIGLGVDYSFYVVDAIKEEMHRFNNLKEAISHALASAGRGVLVTGMTLVAGVALWSFSSVRLQAEMGVLIAIWLTISAVASLLLMPALVYVFKPRFVVGEAVA
jgi:predicted RND superfamily exporter protein